MVREVVKSDITWTYAPGVGTVLVTKTDHIGEIVTCHFK
jgi:hypothetical protein